MVEPWLFLLLFDSGMFGILGKLEFFFEAKKFWYGEHFALLFAQCFDGLSTVSKEPKRQGWSIT